MPRSVAEALQHARGLGFDHFGTRVKRDRVKVALQRNAAAGALAQLDQLPPAELSALLQGWVDGATDRSGRSRLQHALAGLSQVLLSRMQSEPAPPVQSRRRAAPAWSGVSGTTARAGMSLPR